MKPLAVTGVGVVAPTGLGYEHLTSAFAQSVSEQPTETLPAAKFPNARGLEIKNFDTNLHLGDKGHRNLDRLTRFLILAAKQALEHAGLKKDGTFTAEVTAEQIGVCSSTAYGSLDSITELNLVAELEDPRYINPARFPNTVINAAAGYVSIWEDLRAPNVTIVDGNCGAIDAVLSCATHLAHRRADVFLVGGGDVISEPLYVAFQKLGALADTGAKSEPAHDDSVGMRLGEGCAYLCVERAIDAERRGADVLAHITGYGTAFESPTQDAFLLNPSPLAVERAIRSAMDDAGVTREGVDLVVSSISGLPRYDAAELLGIHRVFFDSCPVVAPKATLGEAFSGSAALGLATAIASRNPNFVSPLQVAGPLPKKGASTVLVLAAGYYGNVSAAVIRCLAA